MQCACAVLYCHLWPDRLYNIFRHYLINGTIFGINSTKHNACFEFLYNLYLKYLFQEKMKEILSKMYIGLHAKQPSFVSDCNDI